MSADPNSGDSIIQESGADCKPHDLALLAFHTGGVYAGREIYGILVALFVKGSELLRKGSGAILIGRWEVVISIYPFGSPTLDRVESSGNVYHKRGKSDR